MRRTRIALVGALAVTVLTGCGSERASSVEPLREAPVVAAGSGPPSPTRQPTDEPSRPPTVSATTSSTTAADLGSLGWYADGDQRGAEVDGVWVAVWFSPSDIFPDTMVRYWMLVPPGGEVTPEERLVRSVELLDTTPPLGMDSAFRAGLKVRGVTFADRQVVPDLAADSPGLSGHGSHGLILGESQLRSAATHYFPDAETMCIAYDGVPTGVDAGGPTFLHDASGCPLPLPFHTG